MEAKKLDIKHDKNVVLAPFTTFHIGGKCKDIYHCRTPDEIESVVRSLVERNLPFILIGGGSNLVISDQGVDCAVIRYVSNSPIIKLDGTDVIVSGSTNLDEVAAFAAKQGFEGLNYTTGIPGTVGGAVVGNAGAFGQQVGDVLTQATLLTSQGEKKVVDNAQLDFAYRHSILKQTRDIVLEVVFSLKPGSSEDLLKQRQEWIDMRHERHPNPQTEPCAGSFFRNIEPTSKAGKRQAAAWFLEHAGAFSLYNGGAHVFSGHANMIVNKDRQATAQEIYELSKGMAKLVKDKYDLDLVREVQLVGKFEGMPTGVSDIIW